MKTNIVLTDNKSATRFFQTKAIPPSLCTACEMWQKYVNIAVVKYNTSFYTSIRFEPCRVFHGCVPYNNLDLEMGIRPQKTRTPNSHTAEDILKQTEMISQDVLKNTMKAHIKYKA